MGAFVSHAIAVPIGMKQVTCAPHIEDSVASVNVELNNPWFE
jgi:hypothetical protein